MLSMPWINRCCNHDELRSCDLILNDYGTKSRDAAQQREFTEQPLDNNPVTSLDVVWPTWSTGSTVLMLFVTTTDDGWMSRFAEPRKNLTATKESDEDIRPLVRGAMWQQVEFIKTNMPPSSLGDKNESFRWCKRDELHVFSETEESAQVTFDLSCDRKDTTQICRAKVQSTTKDNWKTWNRKNLNFLFSLFLIVTPICWTTYRKWIKVFTMCFA